MTSQSVLFGQGPGEVLTCFAAAQHEDIVLFRCLQRFNWLFRYEEGVEHIDIGQVSVDGGNLLVTDSQHRR
jgi:hypothetical protein